MATTGTHAAAQISPVATACQVILKPHAIEMRLGRWFSNEHWLEQMLAADRQRLKQITAGISAVQPMNRLLKAEQARKEQLLAALHPCRGLLEGLRIQTSGLAQLPEASSHGLAPLAIGRDTAGECTLHALPRLPSRPRMRQEADMRYAPPVSHQQEPGIASDPLNAGCETEDNHTLIEALVRFQQSDEIPCDGREGIGALTNWWMMHRTQLTPDQSREFNRTVQRFIEDQLGFAATPKGNRMRYDGLLMPGNGANSRQPPDVDLEPRIYTSLEVARILTYSDSTIRRQAEAAWKQAGGVGPCLLKKRI